MFNYYFNIGMIYIFIGILVAFVAVFLFRKKIIGNFWGALIVAIMGSFLGGLLEIFLKDVIAFLTNLNGAVNVFPPLITATVLIMILSRVSDKRDKDS
ncbi:MAG: hypothetical protein JW874_05885 [Spirochaetales bacterium]|nr:hypothetical protein [Spirochaetales bacterium]